MLLGACASAPTSLPPSATQASVATSAPANPQVPEVTKESAPTSAPVETVASPSGGGKILKVRVESDPGSYDPAFWSTTTEIAVGYNIYQGLVRYDPATNQVVNDLAETITPSKDGLRIDFKLKEGIQFQGGYGELTADDVKFSYERMIDPELAAAYAGDWANLEKVEVTGKYTGTIIFKNYFAPLWTTTLPATSGWIISKKYFDAKGKDALAAQPIGTGPYQFTKSVPHQIIVINRNPDYKGTLPEWDEIDFVPIADDNAAEVAIESGELDFGIVSPGSVGRFEGNDNFKVTRQTTANYYWLVINENNPKLKDENVRLAIRYAVDVPAILQAVYDGKYERANAMIAPNMIGYWKDAPQYERDITKAKEYLQKSGVKDLTLTLTLNNERQDPVAAQVIQANLADIGIKVNIDNIDGSAFVDKLSSKEAVTEIEIAYIYFYTSPDPYWDTQWFTCAQTPGWNWNYMCDKEFDQLDAQAVQEIDPAKREQMYIQMQQIMDKKVNSVWVAYPDYYFVARKGLETPILKNGYYLTSMFHSTN
jgi:peptide/nickel transport system substrate-binding protein